MLGWWNKESGSLGIGNLEDCKNTVIKTKDVKEQLPSMGIILRMAEVERKEFQEVLLHGNNILPLPNSNSPEVFQVKIKILFKVFFPLLEDCFFFYLYHLEIRPHGAMLIWGYKSLKGLIKVN